MDLTQLQEKNPSQAWSFFSLKPKFLYKIPERLRTLRFHIMVRTAGLPKFPKLRRGPAALLCFVGLFMVPMACALRPGFQVTLHGQSIGYVEDIATAQLSISALETGVSAPFGDTYSLDGKLHYKPAYAFSNQFQDVEQTVASLAAASDEVDMMAVLTVNGKTIGACASADEVQTTLDTLLETYKTSPSDRARFVEDVNVSLVPVLETRRMSGQDLAAKLRNEKLLDVEVYSTNHYTEAIPYRTQMIQNDQLDQHTTKTMQVGREGEASVQEQVVTLNGVETQRTIVSRAVLTQATDAIVAVGTRSNGIGSGSLISPLTNYRFTSAFKWRDGRWHKGVDLAAPQGTPVYAADNGKVIVSKLSDSYGNYIIIDHQNGVKTLYAHNSSLLVNVGDTVTKGRQIALSGNTGNSTGPHLHFEVHQNGIAVNPLLYIPFGKESST